MLRRGPAVIVGCDPSSKKLVFTIQSNGVFEHFTEVIAKGTEKYAPSHAFKARMATRSVIESLDRMGGHLFIENPVVGRGGVYPTMVQSFISGVVQSEFIEAGFAVHLTPIGTWKSRIVGAGNAKKDDVAEWARVNAPSAWRTGDQDIMDSTAICVYGHHVIELSESIGGRA